MYNIALTRFNETTWNDYYNWCIHNTPVKIKNIIKEKSILFVIEMNDLNKIMGISLIYNKLFNKRYKFINLEIIIDILINQFIEFIKINLIEMKLISL